MTVSATNYSNSSSNLEAFNPSVSNTDELVALLQNGDVLTFEHQGNEFTLTLNPSSNHIELWNGQTLVDNDCQFNSTMGVDGFIELRNSSMLGHTTADALYVEVDSSGSFVVHDAAHTLARTEQDQVLAGQDKSNELSNWTFYRPPVTQPTGPQAPTTSDSVDYHYLNQLQPGQYTVKDGKATDQNGNEYRVYNWPPTANYQVNSDGTVQRLHNGQVLNVDGESGLVELQNGHLVSGIPLNEHQIDPIDASELANGSYHIDENGVVSSSTDSTLVFGKTYYFNQAGNYKVSRTNNQFQLSRQASDGNFYSADANSGLFNLADGKTISAVGNDVDNYALPAVNLNELPPGTYTMSDEGVLVNSMDNTQVMGTSQLYGQAGTFKITRNGNNTLVSRQASDGQFYAADAGSGRYMLNDHKTNPVVGANLDNYAIDYTNYSDLQPGTYYINDQGYIFSSTNTDLVYGKTYTSDMGGIYKISGQGNKVHMQRQASDGNFYEANLNSGLFELVNNQTIPAVGSDLSNYNLTYVDPVSLPAGSYSVSSDGLITSTQGTNTLVMGLSLIDLDSSRFKVKTTSNGAVIELI